MLENILKSKKSNIRIDILLIIPFFSMIFSGFLLQIFYHMKRYESDSLVWGLNRADWLLFHKVAVVIAFSFTLVHLILHYKWFSGVIKKKLFISGNKLTKRTFRLFIMFIIVSLTGLIPWIFGFTTETRHHILEIHDKVAIIFTIYFLYHFAMRHNKIAEYLHKQRGMTNQPETKNDLDSPLT
jgi:hypothetical protein